MLPANVARF